ncbi:MAG: transposase [Eubacteriales bacterium]|nr:transposase [Eubacteriales bacterium]
MSRKLFTEEQQQLLRQNPYVYSVSASRMQLTREFKEIFMAAYNAGESPREILVNHGFDIDIIGERRIWSISQHIRSEYMEHGEFHEGYGPRSRRSPMQPSSAQPMTEKEELQKLRHEVDYLKQEMEFLKKISLIRTTRK